MTASSKDTNKAALTAAAATISSLLPDNNTREVSPADLRDCFASLEPVVVNVIDSYGELGVELIGGLEGGTDGLVAYTTIALDPLGVDLTPTLLPTVVTESSSIAVSPGNITFLGDGWAQVHLVVSASYSSNSQAQLQLQLNGVVKARSTILGGNGATDYKPVVLSQIIPVIAGQTLSVRGRHLNGPGSIFSATTATMWVKYER